MVGDERDIVGVRANYRARRRVSIPTRPSLCRNARRLFLVYLARLNELADHPEFYHLLTNSCTINIVRYANAAGRVAALICVTASMAWSTATLYAWRCIDTTLPFENCADCP